MLDTYGNMPELDLGEFARPHVSRKIRAEQKLMRAGRPAKDSAEKKDRLEWRMRDMICHPVTKDGNWSPALLQKEIAADWLAAYAKYMQPH